MPTQLTYTFRVDGMHCASCGLLIDSEIDCLDGVVSSQTSLRSRCCTVVVDSDRCSAERIQAAIVAAGYSARLESR